MLSDRSLHCTKIKYMQKHFIIFFKIENIALLTVSAFSENVLATRARIFKRLMSPRIDSKELIPPAYVARRAGTIILFLLGS